MYQVTYKIWDFIDNLLSNLFGRFPTYLVGFFPIYLVGFFPTYLVGFQLIWSVSFQLIWSVSFQLIWSVSFQLNWSASNLFFRFLSNLFGRFLGVGGAKRPPRLYIDSDPPSLYRIKPLILHIFTIWFHRILILTCLSMQHCLSVKYQGLNHQVLNI